MTIVDDARVSPLKLFTLVITGQPADAVGVIGGQAVFAFTALTNNPSLVTYQWQMQTDGATWQDMTEETGYYEGVTTAVLTVKAIDNFLATRTSRNFRCQALFSGSVPTYSTTAALTIPIHTEWTAGYGGFGSLSIAPCGCALVGSSGTFTCNAPIVSGFSGPFTYQWTRIGGAAFTCPNPNAATAFFQTTNLPLGATFSIWTCTITSGGNSVTSDPLYLTGFGVSLVLASYLAQIKGQTLNGAALSLGWLPGQFIGPWEIAIQRNIRRTSAPAATIDLPSAEFTTYTWNGTNIVGTAVSLLVFTPFQIVGVVSGAGAGNTVWGL